MLKNKEHYDMLAAFERQHPGRHDKEDKTLWSRGIIYQDGRTNELFLAFRSGYAYAKWFAPQQGKEQPHDSQD